jgi:hypothetical protein
MSHGNKAPKNQLEVRTTQGLLLVQKVQSIRLLEKKKKRKEKKRVTNSQPLIKEVLGLIVGLVRMAERLA